MPRGTLDRERGFEENVDNEDQGVVIASASYGGKLGSGM
jgi:hypothetical protein